MESYNDWERRHPQSLRPVHAITFIGYLYQRLPAEEKKRDPNIDEITRMRNVFSKLKPQKIKKKGYSTEGVAIRVETWPVQFVPVFSELT
ncbi:MAG: hypothetical protein ACTSRA_20885 [Promethearchaeota archaeon]